MKNAAVYLSLLFILTTACKNFYRKPVSEDLRTGAITLKELRKTDWFREEYKQYKPDSLLLDSLQSLNRNFLLIYGGGWCSDTKLFLPRFIKVLDQTGYPMQTLRIFYLDRQKKCFNCGEYAPENYGVRLVPTFIVQDSTHVEKGRIVESPALGIEKDLLRMR